MPLHTHNMHATERLFTQGGAERLRSGDSMGLNGEDDLFAKHIKQTLAQGDSLDSTKVYNRLKPTLVV